MVAGHFNEAYCMFDVSKNGTHQGFKLMDTLGLAPASRRQ